MRRRTKVCVVGLGLLMTLAAWDRVRGRSVEDTMHRTEATFLARAAMHGCDEAIVSTLPIDVVHKTHYGAEQLTPREMVRCGEETILRAFGAGYFERVSLRHAGDAEVISFPDGGMGCYDNLFVPLVVDVRVVEGLEVAIPLVARSSQRRAAVNPTPFIGPELNGLFHDDFVPPRRHRGRVSADGYVPPREVVF